MIELRFIERIADDGPHQGSLIRVLQTRQGACYPWADVKCVTLEQQALDRKHALEDSVVYGDE